VGTRPCYRTLSRNENGPTENCGAEIGGQPRRAASGRTARGRLSRSTAPSTSGAASLHDPRGGFDRCDGSRRKSATLRGLRLLYDILRAHTVMATPDGTLSIDSELGGVVFPRHALTR
jgi:hypothetical protein